MHFRLANNGTFSAMGLLLIATSQLLSQVSSPRDLLLHFCELDARGAQLFPDTQKDVSILFASSSTPQTRAVTVIRNFVVSTPASETSAVRFYVEYIELARIDLENLRLSSLPGMRVRAELRIVDIRHMSTRPPEWRILGPIPEAHIGIDAAIHYARYLRDNAKDQAERSRATKLEATLERLR